MASGVDGDDEERVEIQRLTGRDCNSIQCNSMYDLMFFVVTVRGSPGTLIHDTLAVKPKVSQSTDSMICGP
jgi:hypothetical protein